MKIIDIINKATTKTSKETFKKIFEGNNLLRNAYKSSTVPVGKSPLKAFNESKIFKNNCMPVYQESNANVFLLAKTKAECVDALRCSTPYEKMFLLDEKNNTIISKIIGEEKNCGISNSILNKINSNTIALHGHPAFFSDISAPVSFQDFKLLNSCELKKIIAYNKNGEFSLLQKSPQYKALQKSEFRKLENTYLETLLDYLPTKSKAEVKDYLNKYKKSGEKENLVQILNTMNDFQLTKDGAKATHAFWQTHAQEANLIYKTNYNFNF
jgi:hypothetical protein